MAGEHPIHRAFFRSLSAASPPAGKTAAAANAEKRTFSTGLHRRCHLLAYLFCFFYVKPAVTYIANQILRLAHQRRAGINLTVRSYVSALPVHCIAMPEHAAPTRRNFAHAVQLGKMDVNTGRFFQGLCQGIHFLHRFCYLRRISRFQARAPPCAAEQIEPDLTHIPQIIRHLYNTG